MNKNLTKFRKRLLWKAKQKAKQLEYSFIWTNNGKIYVRQDEDAYAVPNKSEMNIDNILCFACK